MTLLIRACKYTHTLHLNSPRRRNFGRCYWWHVPQEIAHEIFNMANIAWAAVPGRFCTCCGAVYQLRAGPGPGCDVAVTTVAASSGLVAINNIYHTTNAPCDHARPSVRLSVRPFVRPSVRTPTAMCVLGLGGCCVCVKCSFL